MLPTRVEAARRRRDQHLEDASGRRRGSSPETRPQKCDGLSKTGREKFRALIDAAGGAAGQGAGRLRMNRVSGAEFTRPRINMGRPMNSIDRQSERGLERL